MFDRVGVAFEWKLDQPCSSDDLVRVVREAGCVLVVMASAGDCGWSVCWSAGSALALDLFTEAWRTAAGDASSRLETAFAHLRATFLDGARALINDNSYEDDVGGPHTCITAVAWGEQQMTSAWVGGDSALCARDYAVRCVTSAHDYRSEARASGVALHQTAPSFLTRWIGEGGNAVHDMMSATIGIGDILVVCDQDTVHTLGPDAIAFIASTSISPQEAAEDILQAATSGKQRPYASVCVVRREDVHVVEVMSRLADGFVDERPQGAEVERAARRARVLPLVFDLGGTFGFTVEGSAVEFAWDDLHAAPTRSYLRGHILLARQRLSDAHPELACLSPRPTRARLCRQCREFNTRVHDDPELIGCPHCAHLGWLPPAPPTERVALLYRETWNPTGPRSR